MAHITGLLTPYLIHHFCINSLSEDLIVEMLCYLTIVASVHLSVPVIDEFESQLFHDGEILKFIFILVPHHYNLLILVY